MPDEMLKEISRQSSSYMFNMDPGLVYPKKISYGDYRLKHFEIREVYIDGKVTGEYHIKLWNTSINNIINTVCFFSYHFKNCEIGMIDNTNELNLEYQIYIKTTDDLLISVMLPTMENLDSIYNTGDV